MDGFTPRIFHQLCDGIPNTVTFIKVEGKKEILGGYNPIKWESLERCDKTYDSFIFSFKNKNNKDAILSKVRNACYALEFGALCGPKFESDLRIFSSFGEFRDFNVTFYETVHYKKQIRAEDNFPIEDYEVFQILRR
ncbi:hypothetical protein GLOIN_2v1763587 [Rhizophagus clarus]|uniref:TLDc domain-containing protein n=1 Tax=Rhizophagus clarus TaxID=94130 RepID=A0A8H3LWA1_9GLOM|nr:hypothetical protein GLOIN_2v1763587 [Rhizophagus clarus]